MSNNTNEFALLSKQGHRLLQLGIGLLLFTSLWGFAFPYLAAPPLGLSVHTLSSLLAILYLAMGLMWPRLQLSRRSAQFAYWLFIYSSLAIIMAYVLGSVLGAGNETMPLAAGTAHGTAFQELVIRVVGYSSGPTGILSFATILWGLRSKVEK